MEARRSVSGLHTCGRYVHGVDKHEIQTDPQTPSAIREREAVREAVRVARLATFAGMTNIKVPFNFRNWNWGHARAMALSAAVGGGAAFFEAARAYVLAVPNATLFAAFGSVNAFEPIALGAAFAGLAALFALAKHSFVAPPPPAVGSVVDAAELRAGQVYPSPPTTPRMRRPLNLAAVFAFTLLAACTKATAKSAVDVAGNVCEVVVASVDPALPPICTTAQAVADAIVSIVGAHGPTGVGAAPYKPSNAEVYAWLAAHGATKVITQ